MHVPDGFLDAPTSVGTAVVAAGAVAVAVRGARRELDDAAAPLAGLVAVFVFAGQMLNFPVGAGTSGHLIGAALAAILVGPWTATLCLSVVLLVQALLFADGGLTALGTNITLMAVVSVWTAWFVFRGVSGLLRRSRSALAPASFLAGLASVPAAAGVFVLLFVLGGQAPVSVSAVLKAMLGWHTVIGVGEGLITALVVGAVAAARPDLVHGLRGAAPERDLEIREAARA
ncbi:energy-coupling factor ABC transporter permease [Actinomycetota bacterium]